MRMGVKVKEISEVGRGLVVRGFAGEEQDFNLDAVWGMRQQRC